MKFILILLIVTYSFFTAATPQYDDFKNYQHPRFNKFKTTTFPRLEKFVDQELKSLTEETKAVFYPFGGPDISYPLMLFPQAQSYLLIGLEPVGSVDSNLEIPNNLNNQLDSLFRRSFFITSDMSRLIHSKQGVLPLFLAQITLMGGEVEDIKYLEHSFGKGLEITFTYLKLEKKLFYVQTNLTNQGLSDDLIKFIEDNNLFDTCMLKASSYAFHQNIFSKLRSFVITNANVIVQDDTGIPLKDLDKDFKIHLFGNYVGPYGKEWAGYFQKNLYKMYQEKSPKSKLPFCYGYGCGRNPVAILSATRKNKD